ncbi:uncharacterized protein LOC121809876 [Salvia splendens]|uniref:uncharacterized protein LOC121809876 n=1 Tax=Salvia splendens TaxID=180675 RepID=UPI001C269FAB|nr:uncharacterized protein LOC121809876 [Salvia splendens]
MLKFSYQDHFVLQFIHSLFRGFGQALHRDFLSVFKNTLVNRHSPNVKQLPIVEQTPTRLLPNIQLLVRRARALLQALGLAIRWQHFPLIKCRVPHVRQLHPRVLQEHISRTRQRSPRHAPYRQISSIPANKPLHTPAHGRVSRGAHAVRATRVIRVARVCLQVVRRPRLALLAPYPPLPYSVQAQRQRSDDRLLHIVFALPDLVLVHPQRRIVPCPGRAAETEIQVM